MAGYDIIHSQNCRYGVLVVTSTGELRGILEKPDMLVCDDGYVRVRNASGEIDEMNTQPIIDGTLRDDVVAGNVRFLSDKLAVKRR